MVSDLPEWPGVRDPRQVGLLRRFERWLREEAIPAGGIGAVEDVWERHVVDSLVFAHLLAPLDPTDILDIGSGVGLPGIPVAIARPASRVVLLDRAGRRSRLARRAVRVLGVENVDVVEADVGAISAPVPAIVSRASLPPDALRPHLARLLAPGGTGLVAGSRVAPPSVSGYETIEVTVLDRPVWILKMGRP